jgi:hypothetical protein
MYSTLTVAGLVEAPGGRIREWCANALKTPGEAQGLRQASVLAEWVATTPYQVMKTLSEMSTLPLIEWETAS